LEKEQYKGNIQDRNDLSAYGLRAPRGSLLVLDYEAKKYKYCNLPENPGFFIIKNK
jgi:hypothetical protein